MTARYCERSDEAASGGKLDFPGDMGKTVGSILRGVRFWIKGLWDMGYGYQGWVRQRQSPQEEAPARPPSFDGPSFIIARSWRGTRRPRWGGNPLSLPPCEAWVINGREVIGHHSSMMARDARGVILAPLADLAPGCSAMHGNYSNVQHFVLSQSSAGNNLEV